MHAFQSSSIDIKKCVNCSREEIDHTDRATCEVCGNSGRCELLDDILMCVSCLGKEFRARKERAESGTNNNSAPALNASHKVDATLHVQTDIFNAQTIEIQSIKELI